MPSSIDDLRITTRIGGPLLDDQTRVMIDSTSEVSKKVCCCAVGVGAAQALLNTS